jgi:hypothetical protein
VLGEAEEYSRQLELRLERALKWRLEVEQQVPQLRPYVYFCTSKASKLSTIEEQVEQQDCEANMLRQQLGVLKSALDMSPSVCVST